MGEIKNFDYTDSHMNRDENLVSTGSRGQKTIRTERIVLEGISNIALTYKIKKHEGECSARF